MNMKKRSPKAIVSIFTLMALGSAILALHAGGHADHDHDHSAHEGQKTGQSNASVGPATSVDIDASQQLELGIKIAEVPTRTIGDGSDEVSALPKASVFNEDGKHFVFALPEGVKDRFERWEVTLGTSDDFFVEIKTGVFPGDRIVIAGVGSIRQMANSDKEVVDETKEEPGVVAKAVPKTDSSTELFPAKQSSETCPLNGMRVCPNEKRSHASEPAPGCRVQLRRCDPIDIGVFYDRHFRSHELGYFAPHCDEDGHVW